MNTASCVMLVIAIGSLSGPSLATAQTVAKPQGQIAGTAPGSKIGRLQQKTSEIVCRGGDDLRIDRLSLPPKTPGSVTMGVYFLPPKVAAGRDGSGLPPGTCSFFGDQVFGPEDPVGIWFDTAANARQKPMLSGSVGPLSTAAEQFPDAETIPQYLKSPNHYWRFTGVKTNYGHFQATAHQHWKIGSERVLATARKTPAERADLKPQPKKDAIVRPEQSVVPNPAAKEALNPQPLPPKDAPRTRQPVEKAGLEPASGASAAATATPAPSANTTTAGVPANLFEMDDRAIIIVGGKETTAGNAKREIEAELRRSSDSPHTFSVAARKTPAELPKTHTPLVDARAPLDRATQPIQGQAPGGQAADLKMDCTRNWPRISNIQGRISPGTQFTINGTCFGDETGYVEIIGQFSGGNLKPAFWEWKDRAIVAVIPDHLTGILDHTVAISVRRAGDRKQSAAKQGLFVAARDDFEVPDDLWKPTDHIRERTLNEGLSVQSPSTFQVAVNPVCALTDLDVPASFGTIREVRGWGTGPSSEATVQVDWWSDCTARGGDVWCAINFTLKAKASCPRGFAVRPPGR